MHLRQIEVFHAYMLTGSTVGAAQLLGISQPGVSTMLKRIEDEKGLVLFKRVKGRLLPTPEARAIFNQIRAIHEDIGQLDRLIDNLAKGHQGAIRVGVVPALSDTALPLAFKAFQNQYPDIYLSVEVHNSHELLDLLMARRIDMCLTFGDQRDKPLDTEIVASVNLVCAIPKEWARGRKTMPVHDLIEYPIAGMRGSDPIGMVFKDAGKDRDVELTSKIELRNSRTALAMAQEGLAIAVVDPFSAYNSRHDGYTILDLEPAKPLVVSLCSLSDHIHSKAEDAFKICLKNAVQAVRLKD